ncbi:unknown [Collinsella sp. CAG:289]|nr:unknown [Collinsella sp. CAG:289]
MLGPKRAAKDQKHRSIVRNIQRLTPTRPLAGKHGSAHGIARELDTLRTRALKNGAHAWLSDRNKACDLCRLLISKAGNGVLLVQDHRDAEFSRRPHQRKLDIGAKANRHIGLESRILLEGTHQATLLARKMCESSDKRPGARTVKTSHLHRKEVESGLGNQFALETTRLSKETNVVPA